MVLVRRNDSEDPVARERQALVDQRTELERLKRQLGERIEAVRQREEELRRALDRVAQGKEAGVALPPVADVEADRLAARAASLAERERALAAREASMAAVAARGLGAPATNGDAALDTRAEELEHRLRELEEREHELVERERRAADPTAVRVAEIDARLDELRAAEEAFLRTRGELADHSDAIAAREQLLAQRERELDAREDAWGGPDVHELEARLRRLETQRVVVDQGRSFSGGFRRLEQEGTRRPPAA
jgi:DNA repair exonuclease SbcCD ATPase subunit